MAKINRHKPYIEFTFDEDGTLTSAESHNTEKMACPKRVNMSLDILKSAFSNVDVVSVKDDGPQQQQIQAKRQQDIGG